MTTVKLDKVSKRYGTVDAVRDVSFGCDDGEMVALLGPSGCGKSTILKSLAGIEPLTSGEIYFDDYPVSQLEPGARNIAMVFEDYALYPHLSVRKNIEYPLKVKRFSKAEIGIRSAKVTKLLQLDDMLDANVQSLSGGAQQRVSIGRALVRDPNLLLFDEPLSHLDGDQKVQLRMEIKRLQEATALTSILVTHDQTEAIAMCDRIVVMNKGKLQQVGTPDTLYENPVNLFVATFIGEPPMNLLPGMLRQETGMMYAEGLGWKLKLNEQTAESAQRRLKGSGQIVVGIRPEHVQIVSNDVSSYENLISGYVGFIEMRGDTKVALVYTEDDTKVGYDDLVVDASVILVEESARHSIKEGDSVKLNIPPTKILVFGGDDGCSLHTTN